MSARGQLHTYYLFTYLYMFISIQNRKQKCYKKEKDEEKKKKNWRTEKGGKWKNSTYFINNQLCAKACVCVSMCLCVSVGEGTGKMTIFKKSLSWTWEEVIGIHIWLIEFIGDGDYFLVFQSWY